MDSFLHCLAVTGTTDPQVHLLEKAQHTQMSVAIIAASAVKSISKDHLYSNICYPQPKIYLFRPLGNTSERRRFCIAGEDLLIPKMSLNEVIIDKNVAKKNYVDMTPTTNVANNVLMTCKTR